MYQEMDFSLVKFNKHSVTSFIGKLSKTKHTNEKPYGIPNKESTQGVLH